MNNPWLVGIVVGLTCASIGAVAGLILGIRVGWQACKNDHNKRVHANLQRVAAETSKLAKGAKR